MLGRGGKIQTVTYDNNMHPRICDKASRYVGRLLSAARALIKKISQCHSCANEPPSGHEVVEPTSPLITIRGLGKSKTLSPQQISEEN